MRVRKQQHEASVLHTQEDKVLRGKTEVFRTTWEAGGEETHRGRDYSIDRLIQTDVDKIAV